MTGSIGEFAGILERNVREFCEGLNEERLAPAVEMIEGAVKRGNRIHITGIGKPSHVAGYGAALMSSIAVPAYKLDGTEAVHGSCGQLREGDVVICMSNSGETSEMRSMVLAVKNNGCKIIGISRSDTSWLAEQSEVHILARVDEEGGPLNRAPISSVLLECIVLQALSVRLELNRGLTPQEYVKCHPGGKLGELRENEKQA